MSYPYISRIKVDIVAGSTGGFSGDTPECFGSLLQYRYVPHASTPLPTGADVDVVGKTSAFEYLNLDDIGTSAFQRLPRHATSSSTGGSLFYNSTDSEPVVDKMTIGGEALTVTMNSTAAAGASGVLYLWIG